MKSFNVIDDVSKKKGMRKNACNVIVYVFHFFVGSEKKAGILKPQGSLEKSREERELSFSNADAPTDILNISSTNNKVDKNKNKRGQQNVALQSIFKKMEENKQVT